MEEIGNSLPMTQITIEIFEPHGTELRDLWELIYEQATPNFFLSWHWMSTWYNSLDDSPTVLLARQNHRPVGIAMLCQRQVKQFKAIKRQQLLLHKTGNELHDQAWIEYNDFLVIEEYANATRLAFVKYITTKMHWDEMIVGASEHKAFAPYLLNNLSRRDIWKSLSYRTDLAFIRDNHLEYINTLSKNTRYQIKRSLRIYEKCGGIELQFASTVEQAIQWFEDAGPLHIQRWYKTSVGSGYTNPQFVQFHKQLIKHSFDDGKIHLIKIIAGARVVGFLYNFVEPHEIKFYLAATNFNNGDKNLKPGLIAHYLAINHYLKAGYDVYDFMAGESQYKRSLSSSISQVSLSSFKRANIASQTETYLRKLKQFIFEPYKFINNIPELTLILTGGKESISGDRNYNEAIALKLNISQSGIKVLHSTHYQSPPAHCATATNVTFKSSSQSGSRIVTVTETEILELSEHTLAIEEVISHKGFNDLHHVIKEDGRYLVANTGLDSVCEYRPITDELSQKFITDDSGMSRLKPDVDYRKIACTKPHFTHPNYLFSLQDELWVTRCDLMDAVSLDSNKRIEIGGNLVHDGVVFKNNVYFTCVDGQIRVFDTHTLMLKHLVDLKDFVPNLNGWCRGILPIATNLAVVGISKYRQSKKRRFSKQHSHARLLLVDIFKRQVIWDIDTSQLGMDAIFGIHKSST
ncbi:protein involved in cellulose biosynthesis (CelD)-like protein [Glaciecola sp. KUL10]|nr:protein involved in cellulose biosynthesis (CelD)-like protein [Glaciecola sp. KUL10]